MNTLTPTELQSSAWIKLEEHINKRIEDLRRKNDGDLSERDTAWLRGQVSALKNLLAAVQPPPAIAVDEF